MGSTAAETFAEKYHSQPNRIKIAHVGAGAAGLITAYKASKFLRDYDLVVYDKNPGVGGTWLENRYPGVGCDVPSHSYAYTFEPNSEWDGYYARGKQIQKYFVDFADKHGLWKYMCLETGVIQATWLDGEGEWKLDLRRKDGSRYEDRCHVLINGSGPLNRWKWPSIEGIRTYRGALVHTANWDPSIDWRDKRVAVIGTGSSSVQIVPQLVNDAKSLSVFARSTQWIVPPVAWQDLRLFPDDPEKSAMPASAGSHFFTEAEKEVFRTDPQRFLQFRKSVDGVAQEGFPFFLRNHPMHAIATGMISKMITDRLGPDREDLARLFTPGFSPGCRRPTPGEEFLEALKEDDVEVVTNGIERFTEKGIATQDGQERQFDIIICATGFDVGFTPHFTVIGSHGRSMQQDWTESPNTYLSVATPSFPNFFFIGGPTGNWAQGSVLITHEIQAEYAMQCAAKIANEHLHSLAPKQDVTTQWRQHVDAWHEAHSVWAEPCNSWMKYKGRIQLWSGSMLHMIKTLRAPRYEDYEIRWRGDNRFAFLGDGRTRIELQREKGEDVDLAPFIRMMDEPWVLE